MAIKKDSRVLTNKQKEKIKYLYQLCFTNSKICKATGHRPETIEKYINELKKDGVNTFTDFAFQKLVQHMSSEDNQVSLQAIKTYLTYRELTANQLEQNKIRIDDLALRRKENGIEKQDLDEIKKMLVGK